MNPILSELRNLALPPWAKYAAAAALLVATYATGRVHEARRAGDVHAEYVGKQAAQTARIVVRQGKVVTQVQTAYVDRIKTIYVQGQTIEKLIPTFIQPSDLDRYSVNAGFVRVLNAAWSGKSAGPPADFDRGPAGIPLDEVAAIEAGNATSCRAWREQALGWREFYARQQIAINGTAGAWASAAPLTQK